MPYAGKLATPRSLPRTLAFVIGAAVTAVGMMMMVPTVIAFVLAEHDAALGLGASAAIAIGCGVLGWRTLGRPGPIGMKEGFATVGLAWFVLSAFCALPYLFSGTIPGITDAFFESASGLTTTGASVISNPSNLPRGIGIWRGITQWLGGMGVIVLSIAVLPLLGTGGVQLARAETPGGAPDRLTPRFQDTAKRLWLFYVALTGVVAVLLVVGEMDWYQALVHAMTTTATGGFGTESTSIASFSAYTKWVLTAFMFISGASFALHYRALRKPSKYGKSAEFRLYCSLTVIAVVIVIGGLLADHSIGTAVVDGTFNVVSIITTTGFATQDWAAWRPALQILVVGLMFLGGMAGSTSGSVTTFRVGVLTKAAFVDLRRLVYPRGVFMVRFGRDRIPERVVDSVQSFFLFYMFLFTTGTFLLTFIDANVSETMDLVTGASAVAASLGNVGPAIGDVGPTSTYATIPGLGKWLLSGLMIVGRLEIFPVLLLFTRDLWRR